MMAPPTDGSFSAGMEALFPPHLASPGLTQAPPGLSTLTRARVVAAARIPGGSTPRLLKLAGQEG